MHWPVVVYSECVQFSTLPVGPDIAIGWWLASCWLLCILPGGRLQLHFKYLQILAHLLNH